MIAPVEGSGSWPAWTARVPKPGVLSVMAGRVSAGPRRATKVGRVSGESPQVCCSWRSRRQVAEDAVTLRGAGEDDDGRSQTARTDLARRRGGGSDGGGRVGARRRRRALAEGHQPGRHASV